jgi:uncharacterized membrane protein
MKLTIIGVFLLSIGLSIFVYSEYVLRDLKMMSASSALIFLFVLFGVLSILGKDNLIEKFSDTIINRFKK